MDLCSRSWSGWNSLAGHRELSPESQASLNGLKITSLSELNYTDEETEAQKEKELYQGTQRGQAQNSVPHPSSLQPSTLGHAAVNVCVGKQVLPWSWVASEDIPVRGAKEMIGKSGVGGAAIHVYDPRHERLRQEDCYECEASLGYRVRLCLK